MECLAPGLLSPELERTRDTEFAHTETLTCVAGGKKTTLPPDDETEWPHGQASRVTVTW